MQRRDSLGLACRHVQESQKANDDGFGSRPTLRGRVGLVRDSEVSKGKQFGLGALPLQEVYNRLPGRRALEVTRGREEAVAALSAARSRRALRRAIMQEREFLFKEGGEAEHMALAEAELRLAAMEEPFRERGPDATVSEPCTEVSLSQVTPMLEEETESSEDEQMNTSIVGRGVQVAANSGAQWLASDVRLTPQDKKASGGEMDRASTAGYDPCADEEETTRDGREYSNPRDAPQFAEAPNESDTTVGGDAGENSLDDNAPAETRLGSAGASHDAQHDSVEAFARFEGPTVDLCLERSSGDILGIACETDPYYPALLRIVSISQNGMLGKHNQNAAEDCRVVEGSKIVAVNGVSGDVSQLRQELGRDRIDLKLALERHVFADPYGRKIVPAFDGSGVEPSFRGQRLPRCRCGANCKCGLLDAIGLAKELEKESEARGAPALRIGNLSRDVDEQDLYRFFSAVGPVATVRVVRDTKTWHSELHGFVNFRTFHDAQTALQTLDGQLLKGRRCRLGWSARAYGAVGQGGPARRNARDANASESVAAQGGLPDHEEQPSASTPSENVTQLPSPPPSDGQHLRWNRNSPSSSSSWQQPRRSGRGGRGRGNGRRAGDAEIAHSGGSGRVEGIDGDVPAQTSLRQGRWADDPRNRQFLQAAAVAPGYSQGCLYQQPYGMGRGAVHTVGAPQADASGHPWNTSAQQKPKRWADDSRNRYLLQAAAAVEAAHAPQGAHSRNYYDHASTEMPVQRQSDSSHRGRGRRF